MGNDVMELVIDTLIQANLGKAMNENKVHREFVEQREKITNEFMRELDEGQREILDAFLELQMDDSAEIERLSYKQGMTDMFMLASGLLKKEK